MNFNKQKEAPPGGLEPPTFRLTAERASQLRHGGIIIDDLQFRLIKECIIQNESKVLFSLLCS